jgi:dihydrolipoamide dehydrogenase
VYDVVIIGGGPGGYAAGLYAHNFGLSVALVEKDTVGGTCLLRGCIPAKTWLQAAEVFTTVKDAASFGVMSSEPTFDWAAGLERKQKIVNGLVRGVSGLLKSRDVEIIDGFGRLAGPNRVEVDTADGVRELEARAIVLATGSVPSTIPGFEFDGVHIVSSDHALDWPSQPPRVGIVGGGIIGCEFASLLIDLGSEVTIIEMLDQILPGFDDDAAQELRKQLQRRKVSINTGVGVSGYEVTDSGVQLGFGDQTVEVDAVLVAVGRRPLTDGIGLEATKVEMERGFVRVDLETMLTAEPGVYAVGDIVAGTPGLAHGAFAEAIAAITHIATGDTAAVDYRAVPSVVYTHPEAAQVGMTESQANAAGIATTVHIHSFVGVGRAQIIGKNKGFVKIVAQENGPIIGASVVGPHAGELIHELMYAVGWEALPAEAAAFIHAHPTLSEAVGETLMAVAGRGLH